MNAAELLTPIPRLCGNAIPIRTRQLDVLIVFVVRQTAAFFYPGETA